MSDRTNALQQAVIEAYQQQRPLCIVGGNSKAFYGNAQTGHPLSVSEHQGVIDYQPSELVITARAGTPLVMLESLLAEQNQMLPFEPPHFSPQATVGGAVAADLSGPRRPWSGSLRDALLGCTLINGRGERLTFGGQVMKNVAGYDVTRLMAGAMGTLGLLLQVSVKTVPKPELEKTLSQIVSANEALNTMSRWSALPLPLSGLCYDGERLHARLSASAKVINAAARRMGGDLSDNGGHFWHALREQQLPFFHSSGNLWRLSIAPATQLLDLQGEWLHDWGGAQRWLKSDAPGEQIFQAAEAVGGHATLMRTEQPASERFQPLPAPLMRYHQRLKEAFDPAHLFNPNRLYPGW